MHGRNQPRGVGDSGQTVSTAGYSPTRSSPVTTNAFAIADPQTTPAAAGIRMGEREVRPDGEPETGYLERLRAELVLRGRQSELITLSYKPRLRIDIPDAYGGFSDAEFEDNVVAATGPDGRWSYWWPWAEEICGADDPVKAAEVIITGLGLDTSDGGAETRTHTCRPVRSLSPAAAETRWCLAGREIADGHRYLVRRQGQRPRLR